MDHPEKNKVLDYITEQRENVDLYTADTEWNLEDIIVILQRFADEVRKILQLWERQTEWTDSDDWLPFIEVATFITTLEVVTALSKEGINRNKFEFTRDMIFHGVEAFKSIADIIEGYYEAD